MIFDTEVSVNTMKIHDDNNDYANNNNNISNDDNMAETL